MRAIRSLLLVAAVAVPASAQADGLIYKLPADGTGVTYEMEFVKKDANSEVKMTGTLSIASVGKKKVKGTACRWIEFTLKMNFLGRARTIVAKFLIPESDLGKGKFPLSNIKAGWMSQGEQGDRVREMSDPYTRMGGPIPAFLPRPLKDVKQAKPVKIDTGIGKITAKKLTGKTEYEQGNENRTDKFIVDYELQLADKAPFGVAAAKITMKEYVNRTRLDDTITITLKLKSIDKNVKSGLPDKN